MPSPFESVEPAVDQNARIRTPQREAYGSLAGFAREANGDREVGIVLPVGCGKSGCITLAPFAFRARRVLVVAPGLNIATQLMADFDPTNAEMFYAKCGVLPGPPYPEPAEIRSSDTQLDDLENADVVVTNIQQLQGQDNRWLERMPADFFDLILFDEGHHNVAASWTALKKRFPNARIVNFSATPLRADGQLMAGRILYSYPIVRAIKEGYVKRLKAVVLNPRTLRYVRRKDGQEIEVDLEEVRRLGEEDADFRRSIVTSTETLNTIVDASIRELDRLRRETGENRLKIIASALNFAHCIEIVEAYRARGRRAAYVHSKEGGEANRRVLERLENHELDVIVQVRKLGEGFDHKYLSVAAIFSVFSNLSPFVQFVGRIMRVIEQNNPVAPLNQGVVVFHAGANVARRWSDFQSYTGADQEYFDQLLPMEGLDFSSREELEVDPIPRTDTEMEVRSQSGVQIEELQLIRDDPEALAALRVLQSKGYTADGVRSAFEELKPVPVTRQRQRRAARSSLDDRIRNEAAYILQQRGINPEGQELDKKRLNRSNLIVMKSAIDRQANTLVERGSRQRGEFTKDELDRVEADFPGIVDRAMKEVFGG